jgi:adenylate cyclase
LLKKNLLVGRREKCDIVLRFKNVSAHHCQLTVRGGYWYVRDLDSLNGVKVNNVPVAEKRLAPGDRVTIAKHRYRIMYAPSDLGAVGPPPPDEPVEDIMSQSLLQRAGLEKQRRVSKRRESRRYDVTDDSAGQLKNRRETD